MSNDGEVDKSIESRTKSSIKIAYTNILYRIAGLSLNFLIRTIFIKVLGEGYFGLNALFTSILNALSLTELGFGSAVTYYLYKPVAENDTEKIKTIVEFFRKIYIIVGVAILILGTMLLPFLPHLVNMETDLSVNLYLVYYLCLLNSALPYMVSSYSQIVISAMRKGYIINTLNLVFLFISTAVCSIAILLTKNYILFLLVKLIISLLNNYMIQRRAFEIFPPLKEKKIEGIKTEDKKKIYNDVKSIFLFRVSSTIANSVDNIVLSAMFGIVLVGYNSNYEMIISAVTGTVSMLIYSASSNVGNLIAKDDKSQKIRVFRELDLITYIISVVCFSAVYNLSTPFIMIWLRDSRYLLDDSIVFLKALSMFLGIVLTNCYVFREAMGLFEYGRYRNLICGICNLVLTIVMAKTIGTIGVFLSTVISVLFFAEFVFPKIVFRYGFESQDFWKEQLKLGGKILWAIGVAMLVKYVLFIFIDSNNIMTFVIRAIIAVVVSGALTIVPYCRSDELKDVMKRIKRLWKRRII
ncbi:MAG: hypothetical protein HFG88_04060 [Dorea sp.]|nr:hypothetical protein [Dorea sp.]